MIFSFIHLCTLILPFVPISGCTDQLPVSVGQYEARYCSKSQFAQLKSARKFLQTRLSVLVRGLSLSLPALSSHDHLIRYLLASCRFHWYLDRILRQSSLEHRLSEYSCSNCKRQKNERTGIRSGDQNT